MAENAADWDNLARAVKHARHARRWSIRDACAAAGLSTSTWINAEKGMRVSGLTLAGIIDAFGWRDETVNRLLAGQSLEDAELDRSPASDGHSDGHSNGNSNGHSSDGHGDVVDLAPLSEDDKAAVWAIIESLKAKGRPSS